MNPYNSHSFNPYTHSDYQSNNFAQPNAGHWGQFQLTAPADFSRDLTTPEDFLPVQGSQDWVGYMAAAPAHTTAVQTPRRTAGPRQSYPMQQPTPRQTPTSRQGPVPTTPTPQANSKATAKPGGRRIPHTARQLLDIVLVAMELNLLSASRGQKGSREQQFTEQLRGLGVEGSTGVLLSRLDECLRWHQDPEACPLIEEVISKSGLEPSFGGPLDNLVQAKADSQHRTEKEKEDKSKRIQDDKEQGEIIRAAALARSQRHMATMKARTKETTAPPTSAPPVPAAAVFGADVDVAKVPEAVTPSLDEPSPASQQVGASHTISQSPVASYDMDGPAAALHDIGPTDLPCDMAEPAEILRDMTQATATGHDIPAVISHVHASQPAVDTRGGDTPTVQGGSNTCPALGDASNVASTSTNKSATKRTAADASLSDHEASPSKKKKIMKKKKKDTKRQRNEPGTSASTSTFDFTAYAAEQAAIQRANMEEQCQRWDKVDAQNQRLLTAVEHSNTIFERSTSNQTDNFRDLIGVLSQLARN